MEALTRAPGLIWCALRGTSNMRTATYEPSLPATGVALGPRGDRPSAEPAPTPWQSHVFAERPPARTQKRRATRYERFTTRMVLVSSLIMLGVTACLHVFNYGLETVTSSTSGTHESFSKDSE